VYFNQTMKGGKQAGLTRGKRKTRLQIKNNMRGTPLDQAIPRSRELGHNSMFRRVIKKHQRREVKQKTTGGKGVNYGVPMGFFGYGGLGPGGGFGEMTKKLGVETGSATKKVLLLGKQGAPSS